MKKILSMMAAVAVVGAASMASAQVTITDFEAFNAGDSALFRQASYSGSTTANIAAVPASTTAVDATEPAQSGTKSLKATFTWVDSNNAAAWCRFTTFNVVNVGNPQIDPTKNLAMYVKVTQGALEFRSIGGRDSLTNPGPIGNTTGSDVASVIEQIGNDNVAARTINSAVNNAWTQIVFDLPTETVTGLTGNGTIEGTFLTWDNVRLEPVAGNNDVTFFIDDVRQDVATSVSEWSVYR